MSRPTWSESAQLKFGRLSGASLFAWVEGDSDRGFYDELLRTIRSTTKVLLRSARELEDGGGKQTLLARFRDLVAREELKRDIGGKRMAEMFFLDKDLDEIQGALLLSDHLVYTKYYHLENYYYCSGVTVRSAAMAANVPIEHLVAVVGNEATWRKSAAEKWREWLVMCIHATLRGASCQCHMKSPSQINGADGSLDEKKREIARSELRRALGVTDKQLGGQLIFVRRRINRAFSDGTHDAVFPGKWYRSILLDDVRRKLRALRPDVNGFPRTFESTARGSIDYSSAQFDHLREPAERLCKWLEE